jgi:hypothetical protein
MYKDKKWIGETKKMSKKIFTEKGRTPKGHHYEGVSI